MRSVLADAALCFSPNLWSTHRAAFFLLHIRWRRRAHSLADWQPIAPAFGTACIGYEAVGFGSWNGPASATRGLRVVAIGGITLERAADVIRAGADSVAVISDLLSTGDPRARVREYLGRLAV
jgi:thiamine monophosphate synthase